MISLDELKQRFPVRNIPPYGECVVIPGKEFDPDWEAFLDEQGYGSVFTDIGGTPVTLVLTIKRHGDSKKTVYEPRRLPEKEEPPTLDEPLKKHPYMMKGPVWTRKDEDRLVRRFSELTGNMEGKSRALTKEFQGRSAKALLQKFKKLVKAGLARPVKRGRPKKVLGAKGLEKALENVCPDCGLPKDLCCCDEEKKESLRQERMNELSGTMEEIGKGTRAHVEKSPTEKVDAPHGVYFKAYCRKCKTNRTVEDNDVWRVCPICLEPLIVWNVQETE